MRAIAAVVFDIGGVVQDSPLHAIARYERDRGIAPNAINRAVVAAGEGGAWARLERGELTVGAFCVEPLAEGGLRRPGPPPVVGQGRGAQTNNWVGSGPPKTSLHERFDVFVESAVVGLRKPDPRIYELVCRELGVAPARVAFLDDIGRNLKPARALGMATIKVDDPDAALRELGALLGFDLIY